MAKKEVAPKPKLTSEQRAAKRQADAQARKDREAAAAAEFERNRPQIWLGMWVKAMRIALLFRANHRDPDSQDEFIRMHDWWFEQFKVDPLAQSFRIDDFGGPKTEASIRAQDVEHINVQLDNVFTWHADYLEQKERERQEQLEWQRRRDAALAKLNDDDKAALGIR